MEEQIRSDFDPVYDIPITDEEAKTIFDFMADGIRADLLYLAYSYLRNSGTYIKDAYFKVSDDYHNILHESMRKK